MKVACASSEMSEYFRPYYPDLFVIGGNDVPPDLDLLIVTGGEDINPALYGQSPAGAYGWNDVRDRIELRAIRAALSFRNVKVMGVCRGLQIMNAFMGGSLFQHIGNPHKPSHRILDIGRKHPLSWLTHVNSLHHQGIRNLGENYESGEILSVADDGIPEIVRWGARTLAVQFHPEFFGETLGQRFFSVVNDWVEGKTHFYREESKTWKMPTTFTLTMQAAEQAMANLSISTESTANAYAIISESDFTDETPPIHDEDGDEDDGWNDDEDTEEEEDE